MRIKHYRGWSSDPRREGDSLSGYPTVHRQMGAGQCHTGRVHNERHQNKTFRSSLVVVEKEKTAASTKHRLLSTEEEHKTWKFNFRWIWKISQTFYCSAGRFGVNHLHSLAAENCVSVTVCWVITSNVMFQPIRFSPSLTRMCHQQKSKSCWQIWMMSGLT